jgi:transglutaminase-like putative cysteine protease
LRIRLFLLPLLLVPALLRAKSYGDFEVRPAPSWVEHLAVDPAVQVPRGDVRYGTYAILTDHEVRVTNASTTEYHRRVRKVISSSGVQHASELSFDFDPTYQQLVLHDVALIRGGARINELTPSEVRVIEKEQESDEKIYDGLLTAVVFLKDVRPGDVIEYSWSLEGSNPLLGGKYADEFDLTSTVPTRLLRHRLLWPSARPLHHRSTLAGLAPRVAGHGDETELVWERTNVPAIEVEDETPEWFDPYDSIQLSEFGTWSEVAHWSDELFRADAASTEAVKKLADRIRSEHGSQRDRIAAAIRFVQDDVRYLGIEMGRSSHEPHQPSVTLDRRWGDCKDKAFLLATLLRELGVEAYPALVNTKLRHELDRRLPSPFLFDHVITQVFAGGHVYWIDGTIADQGGTLETIETPNDERALVVRQESEGLTAIVTNERGSAVIEQTYSSPDYQQPTTLDVRSTYSGTNADEMRAWLASRSVAELAKEHINRYAIDQPKIESRGEPRVSDDRVRNVIVVTEHYVIRDLWKRGEWTWYPRAIERHLHRPDTMIRSMPLAVDYPLNVTQKMTFNLPEHLDIETSSHVTSNGSFRYESRVDNNGHALTLTHTMRALRDSVAVSDVPDHLTKLNDIWDDIGYSFGPGKDTSAAADIRRTFSRVPGWAWAAISLAVIVGICVMLALPRRRLVAYEGPRRSDRVASFRPGEAPSSAFPIRDGDEIEEHLAALGCWCGAAISAPVEVQRALYDEREMTIASRHCVSCGREQSVYFTRIGFRRAV